MIEGAIAGLIAGGLYAMIAVAMTVMARLARVLNFAVAAVGMFGAYIGVWLTGHGVPVGVALIGSVVAGAVCSAALGQVIGRWLADADLNRRSAVTVAAVLLMISLTLIMFGNRAQTFVPVISGTAVTVAGVAITWVAVVLVALAAALAAGTVLLLNRTGLGHQLVAAAERPVTAELLGLRVGLLNLGIWAGIGAIAALGVTIAAPAQTNDPVSLSLVAVPASAAALLGGFRRLDLAVVGGLAVGALQGALAQYQSLALLHDWLPLLVVVAFLVWTQRKEVWDVVR